MSELAEYLIFCTKMAPDDIAALKLKIGRSYAVLQPMLCCNLNRLFWPLLRRRRTFAPVPLTSQISLFQLEFFDDFRTQGRAYMPVSAELCQSKIACFKKKLRPSEDRSFPRFFVRIPERSLLALLSENLARIGRVG